jgi:hypothetical protein
MQRSGLCHVFHAGKPASARRRITKLRTSCWTSWRSGSRCADRRQAAATRPMPTPREAPALVAATHSEAWYHNLTCSGCASGVRGGGRPARQRRGVFRAWPSMGVEACTAPSTAAPRGYPTALWLACQLSAPHVGFAAMRQRQSRIEEGLKELGSFHHDLPCSLPARSKAC